MEAELGLNGRVILRSSGTEPTVRVMVEAPTIEEVDRYVQRLALRFRQLIETIAIRFKELPCPAIGLLC